MDLPSTKIDIQIRFSDLDPLNHVTNSIYLNYFEIGRLDWFKKIGIPSVSRKVVANINVDYLKEIKLGDKVSVETSCIKIGNKSLTLAHDIISNGELVTKSTVVVVGLDERNSTCSILL